MKHEPIVLIVDSKEFFDAMVPPLSRELGTTHLIHCDNRKAAMDVIESDVKLDLIFADWELAGPEFIDAVRRDPENRYTPLVVTTGRESDTMIAQAMRLGANDHIGKPFLEKGLLNVVRRVTHRQERRRQRRLHPDREYRVQLERTDAPTLTLRLKDFSLECVQTTGRRELCRDICIGDSGRLQLEIEDYRILLDARLIRIEEDPTPDAPGDAVLLTFRLTESHEQRSTKLAELLDEYADRW
ncbi:MAG TPA: response regulator [Sedimenticola thiotaurini]|uniref:Response regulator n=1 Tax=Sedimenticola thiotaurini TaxID=1543721 RepID=A0A831W9N0_9GAMM|nr:response regulator [Sedimenticola thiotaurini]